MGGETFYGKISVINVILQVLVLMTIAKINQAFPRDRELMREYQLPPGVHHLMDWMPSVKQIDVFSSDAHALFTNGKRGSAELTSAIIGIPKTIIDNGRKK